MKQRLAAPSNLVDTGDTREAVVAQCLLRSVRANELAQHLLLAKAFWHQLIFAAELGLGRLGTGRVGTEQTLHSPVGQVLLVENGEYRHAGAHP